MLFLEFWRVLFGMFFLKPIVLEGIILERVILESIFLEHIINLFYDLWLVLTNFEIIFVLFFCDAFVAFQLVKVYHLLLVHLIFVFFIALRRVQLLPVNSKAVQEFQSGQFPQNKVHLLFTSQIYKQWLQASLFSVGSVAYLAQFTDDVSKEIFFLGDLVVV